MCTCSHDASSIFSRTDVHVHLQSHLNRHGAKVLLRQGRTFGVNRFVCAGTFPGDWREIELLAREEETVFPAMGLHPWYIKRAGNDWESLLADALVRARPRNRFCPAVGEMGLDFAVADGDREVQIECCSRQLAIAHDMFLPVILHCVRAADPLYAIVEKRDVPLILLHSFHGTKQQALRFSDFDNLFFSFSAEQILSVQTKVVNLVRTVPLNRILLESDSPRVLENNLRYPEDGSISPGDLRQPSLIPALARCVADLRNIAHEQFLRQLRENEDRFFSLWPRLTGPEESS